nr:uncharacterized protein LOC120962124 [Aegilops tauschii subsp. strangulata]
MGVMVLGVPLFGAAGRTRDPLRSCSLLTGFQVFICFLHRLLPLPLCKGYNSFVLFPSSRLVDYQRHGRLPPPHIFASCHSHTHIERRGSPHAPRICFLPAAAALCRPRQISSGAAISVPCLTPPLPDATTATGSRGRMTKEAGDGGRLRHVRRPPRSLLQHTRPRAHPELSPPCLRKRLDKIEERIAG